MCTDVFAQKASINFNNDWDIASKKLKQISAISCRSAVRKFMKYCISFTKPS